MLKTIDKILDAKLFKFLILFSTIFTLIPLLHFAYGGYIKYILAFGIAVCVWQLFRGQLIGTLKNKESIALLCFALFYAISIVINRSSCFEANVKQLVYMVVLFILLFSVDRRREVKSVSKEMTSISAFIVFISFVVSFPSFLTYRLNISEWYYIGEKARHVLGMVTVGRFYGLYNPNTSGAIAVISILLSLYLLLKSKISSKVLRFFVGFLLIGNICFQFFMLLISLSRGSYYSFLVSIAFLVFVLFLKNFRRDEIKIGLRIIIATLACAFVLFGVVELSNFVQLQKDKVIAVSFEDADNPELDTSFEDSIEKILSKYLERTSGLEGLIKVNLLSVSSGIGRENAGVTDTTGRVSVWKAGFKVFLDSPIFGNTREGLVEPVCEVLTIINGNDRENESVTGGGLHNIYLTILCASGVVGFITLLVLFTFVFISVVKQLLIKDAISYDFLFGMVICVYFFVSELVESRIMYTVSFFNVVFWIYFGYLNYFSLKGKEASEEKS